MKPFPWQRTSAACALLALSLVAASAGAGPTPASPVGSQAVDELLTWPRLTRAARPGSYWWWMGSAVDKANLTRELQRYHDAGWGAVHIIPIYGAKGWEDRCIDYLSPEWMEMLRYTVAEAQRLDLNVDMTTGTGWCFGGPQVSDQDANASVVVKTYDLGVGERLQEKFHRQSIQALVAFGPNDIGVPVDLTDSISPNGEVFFSPGGNWIGPQNSPPPKSWQVYAISQKPSGQKVKRHAPGGAGWMLNLIYPPAMTNYLRRFDEAFARYTGPKPRAQYHDSYEYRSDWAPDFFAQFEQRRGYRLQTELPALFGKALDDHSARVKSDYRETVSDIMAEVTLPLWVKWSHDHGFLTRNEAHGSPGNLLDLYAVADIPETEMFSQDRNKLVSKFASSAAHVTGGKLVAAETGTWLKEHFTATLADLKYLLDDLFLSGINHVFYHGTCYSPDEAGWPGWLFYASTEMNPRNAIWRDVPALNAYVGRCQSVLQSGQPDNDILLYWPIYDFWHDPQGRLPQLTVHARAWFEDQSIGRAAERLWNRGYAFDYVSDRQLTRAVAARGGVEVPGGRYRVVVVPRCGRMPLPTLQALLALAEAGATVIFEDHLPEDVPGWGALAERRAAFQRLRAGVRLNEGGRRNLAEAKHGQGRLLVGDLESALAAARVPREPMLEHAGLMCVRRRLAGERCYFIANRSDGATVDDWLALGTAARSVVMMDPMTGQTGVGALRPTGDGTPEVYVQLRPGASLILRATTARAVTGPAWQYWRTPSPSVALAGRWRVRFIDGGPELPAPFATSALASWTKLGDTNAQRFAGTARFALTFDAPGGAPTQPWFLDLGRVCQSARVRLNDRDLGTVLIPPFRVIVDHLRPRGNVLEVEVTNLSANRIRDLDRRGVKWKDFHDINFVGLDYKPFDASHWPLSDSGLLGPVTLTAAVAFDPARK